MPNWRDHTLDLTPFAESPTLRRLWLAGALSSMGSRLTAVTMAIQVFDLTDSKAKTGLLGLCAGLPYLCLSMYGGVLADRIPRRRIMLTSSTVGAACATALWLNARLDEPSVPVIFVVATALGCTMALSSPARMSLTPLLVRPELIPAAAALDQISFQLAAVGGPALAGLLIAGPGTRWTYFIDAVSYGVGFVLISRAGALPRPAARALPPLTMIREGLGFLRRRRPLQASFLADIIAMIFGMPMALLPAVAAERYGGNDISLGFLYSAVPTGMLVAAVLSGWTRRVHRHGLGVIGSVCAWGVAISLFSITGPFWLSFLMLAVAGAGDAISGVFRMSILQTGTPPEMMGRLMGVGMAVWAAGPALGDAEAGLVAELTTTDLAIASGGLACIVGILALARLWPEFRRYDITHARAAAAAPA